MTRISNYNFSEAAGSGTSSDSAGSSSQDAQYMGDAGSNGSGSAVFDGQDDYVIIDPDPSFGLSQGTIIMDFTQTTASTGNNPYGSNAAQTLFSVDSANLDDGGHLTIYIKSNGEVGVRHQTADSRLHYSGGSITLGEASWISYSWGPDGSTLVVDGTVVDTGTEALTMAGDVEPIVFGASQAHSGDGTADDLRGYFEGDISRVQIHDEPLAENTPVPCFVAGTPILTPHGEVPVEQLPPVILSSPLTTARNRCWRSTIEPLVKSTRCCSPSCARWLFRAGPLGTARICVCHGNIVSVSKTPTVKS